MFAVGLHPHHVTIHFHVSGLFTLKHLILPDLGNMKLPASSGAGQPGSGPCASTPALACCCHIPPPAGILPALFLLTIKSKKPLLNEAALNFPAFNECLQLSKSKQVGDGQKAETNVPFVMLHKSP